MTGQLAPQVGPDDHAQGPADAPVTLVEYGDFQCPYCGAAYPVVHEVQRVMGKRLRFVFRNFPLTQAHPHAEHAAEMAEAAGSKGKFWEMHALLFQNQRALDDQHLLEYAAKAGIDPAFAASALTAHSFADKVKQDFRSGVRSGVNGTPTFYVNGERYDGSADAESMIEALEDAIGDKP